LSEADDRIQIVGCGDTSLIRFLADKLRAPDMTGDHAVGLAAYLVKKATQYVDLCGEPIDVILVNGSNNRAIPPEETTPLVAAIEAQEEYLPTLLVLKALS
jgi:20S proteasome alpha/beta subunit